MKRPKLGYANVVATAALLVAFGASAPFATGTPDRGHTQIGSSTLGLVRVYKKKVNLPSPTPVNYSGRFTVRCPEDQHAIAGGGRGSIDISGSSPTDSSTGTAPGSNPDFFSGWTVSGGAPPLLIGASQTVYVVCVA